MEFGTLENAAGHDSPEPGAFGAAWTASMWPLALAAGVEEVCTTGDRSVMDWTGMDWNGLGWNGMEWNGMERNGMEWNGIECAQVYHCGPQYNVM